MQINYILYAFLGLPIYIYIYIWAELLLILLYITGYGEKVYLA